MHHTERNVIQLRLRLVCALLRQYDAADISQKIFIEIEIDSQLTNLSYDLASADTLPASILSGLDGDDRMLIMQWFQLSLRTHLNSERRMFERLKKLDG